MPAPRKYDDETRQRAVRMYQERYAEGDVSRNAACREVGQLLGPDLAQISAYLTPQKIPRKWSHTEHFQLARTLFRPALRRGSLTLAQIQVE